MTVGEETLGCDEVVTETFEEVFSCEGFDEESSVEVIEDEVSVEVEFSDEFVSKTGGGGSTTSDVSPWKSFSVLSPSGFDSSSVEGVHLEGVGSEL